MESRNISFLSLAALLLSAVISAAANVEPSSVRVHAALDKDSATIGDKIIYSITVEADKNIEIKFPDMSKKLQKFIIKDSGFSTKGWWRRRRYRKWYELNSYNTGAYTIPPAVIQYRTKGAKKWKKIKSNALGIYIKSVLKNSKNTADIRAIASPLELKDRIGLYILVAVIVLLVLSAIVFIVLKSRKKKRHFTPALPAHEIAYQALRELQSKNYLKRGEVKNYYIELSNIVRKYIEDRFNLRAPEMTTEEFLNAAGNNEAFSSEQRKLLSDFLSHCDLVKFAKYLPQQKEAELSFESAKRLIDQTKEVLEIQEVK